MSRLPNKQRLKDMEKARRQRKMERIALTKQSRLDSIDHVKESDGQIEPDSDRKNQMVEDDQEEMNLTPLEVELGTFFVE